MRCHGTGDRPRLLRRFFAIAALGLAALVATSGDGRAESIFDFLFGPESAPARRAPEQPRVHGALRAAAPSGWSGGYCVRACDGYYFPAVGASRAARQQGCEYACPSAPMTLYEGGAIENARNAKGEKYARLATAFAFRDKAVAQCACNKPETSQALFVRISRSDPTLREGDVLMTPDGALVYRGGDFTPFESARVSSWERQRLRTLLEQAKKGRRRGSTHDETPVPPQGVTQMRKEEAAPPAPPAERHGQADRGAR